MSSLSVGEVFSEDPDFATSDLDFFAGLAGSSAAEFARFLLMFGFGFSEASVSGSMAVFRVYGQFVFTEKCHSIAHLDLHFFASSMTEFSTFFSAFFTASFSSFGRVLLGAAFAFNGAIGFFTAASFVRREVRAFCAFGGMLKILIA
jgi:hypothetical protein